MSQTVHFFIPLGQAIAVPHLFAKTKYPSGQNIETTGVPSPTNDSLHFIFNQLRLQEHQHVPMEAGFQLASARAGKVPQNSPTADILRTSHQTVVEVMVELPNASSISEKPTETKEGNDVTNAFEYAISELNSLLRAISLATRGLIPLVSRESLPPFIMGATSDRKPWMMIDQPDPPPISDLFTFALNFNIPTTPDDSHDYADLENWIDAALTNITNHGPFTTYLDFLHEANLSFHTRGNYRVAAIMYAAACESLIDELLQHHLWEKGLRPEEAAKTFTYRTNKPRGIVDLAKNELGRIYFDKGWNSQPPSAIKNWITNITSLRNKAIHDGLTPTAAEVRVCEDTVVELVTFLGDILFETRDRHPITTLALLGKEGLDRRGGWEDSPSAHETSLEDINYRLRVFRRWANALSYFRSGQHRRTPPTVEGSTSCMVIQPNREPVFYLIDKGGIFAQRVDESEITTSEMVDDRLSRLKVQFLPEPALIDFHYDSITLRDDPTWEEYTYDVLPGHEVNVPSYFDVPKQE